MYLNSKIKKIMAKYKCTHKKCIDFDIIKTEYGSHTLYVGNEVKDLKAVCPTCGKQRELVEETKLPDGLCTTVHGRKNVYKS